MRLGWRTMGGLSMANHIGTARFGARRRASRLVLLGMIVVLQGMLTACITTPGEPGYGMQEGHRGFVPARTAVLPCQKWPDGARFAALPLTSAKDLELAAICDRFDAHVLEAFTGQPYMRGFSPTFVRRQLDAVGRPDLLAKLPELWRHEAGDCQDCKTAAGFYALSIARKEGREAWHAWLSELSESVRNADSVLLPFVLYAYERRLNDRGLLIAERAAGVALLLVDTGTGELLWAGARQAALPRKRLESKDVSEPLEPPPWEDVLAHLFIEDLWQEYPGRQVF